MWRAITSAEDVAGRRDSWAQTVCLACVETLDQVDAAILALRGGSHAEEVRRPPSPPNWSTPPDNSSVLRLITEIGTDLLAVAEFDASRHCR
ncbi:hypothetical protein ATP06_0219860 [Amycolatopsis regifaucium]|uniref:Uncharacterized protein n=1 Tax=Amycolatopsis regifaucium TaxID=546365 RepID=A0ABX3DS65_9PSEU|nr:hypothetical protein ATP06_0219860 [Amycolatopsis regifaucium]